ncbi:MAG: hypothetical protein FGM57_03210 [Candidatus Taylorbacteria bacterium]|nr:hypothetical protein [Candidatus Taylorbacteria bacterium]
MNQNLDTYKQLLLQEEQTLVDELNNLGVTSKIREGVWEPIDKNAVDPADREDVALSLEDYENAQDTIRVLESQLHEVRHALEKITHGTYGICEVSGEPIEEDRLRANPAARTCKAHMH